MKYYWECLRKHIGIVGNSFENRLGTHWEPGKRGKKSPPFSPFPHLKPKRKKKLGTPEHCHWLYEISFSKTVRHHFQPGLIPSLQTGGTNWVISESTHNIATGQDTELITNWRTQMVEMLLTLVSPNQCSDKLGLGEERVLKLELPSPPPFNVVRSPQAILS
jgi:hypothetical protein